MLTQGGYAYVGAQVVHQKRQGIVAFFANSLWCLFQITNDIAGPGKWRTAHQVLPRSFRDAALTLRARAPIQVLFKPLDPRVRRGTVDGDTVRVHTRAGVQHVSEVFTTAKTTHERSIWCFCEWYFAKVARLLHP